MLPGSPLAARQVVRVLHALSRKESLPWHRVINSGGTISLSRGAGFEVQKKLLETEGVRVSEKGRVDMKKHLWKPRLNIDEEGTPPGYGAGESRVSRIARRRSVRR